MQSGRPAECHALLSATRIDAACAARGWLPNGKRILHQSSIIDDGEHSSESIDVDERIVINDDQIGLKAGPY
jgi:hypothetical protein